MTSHEEKLMMQWRKDHPYQDFFLQLFVCFIAFGVVPTIFGILFKWFGLADSAKLAWVEGFGLTLVLMLIASFLIKAKNGKF